MEERILENTPRVGLGGPVDTRESHTSPEVCRAYTGPARNALEGVEAAAAANGGGGALSRDGPKLALLTAPVADILTMTENSRHTAQSPVVQLERMPDLDNELLLTTASEGEGGSRVATPVPTKKNPGFFFKPGSGSEESGSESAASRYTDKDADGAKDRFRRKRRVSALEDSPEKDRGVAAKLSSKRGRGRPPTTGKYVGWAKAKKDHNDELMRSMEVEAEQMILESGRRIPTPRTHLLSDNSSHSDATAVEERETTAASLGVVITESLGAITSVTQKSKNLKGTSVATLKKATQALSEAFSTIMNRSVSDETRALEAANARLSRELNELKVELEAVKRKLADAQPQPAPVTKGKELDVEELLQRAVREAVAVTSARIDARIEGLEARLLPEPRLRPPLAADRKRDEARDATSSASKAKERTPEPEPTVTTLSPPLNPGPALKQKRKKVKKSAAAIEAAAARRDTVPTTAAQGPYPTTQWSEVVRRGGKVQKKDGKKEVPKKKRKNKKRGGLRAPKSAAVVITLQPEAEKRGMTYKDVMEKAKQHLDLVALEVPHLKFKRAVTGARMYEIPGTACKEKADILAGKLKEALGETDVRISRPQKCAELRITGLDDSASAAEIAAAIASCGGCAVDDVKVGEIRVDRSGRGTAWVKCPVEAAKIVTAPNTKLYVGWIVVRATLLSTRIMRCYRCHEAGHTRTTCPSETDRGDLCFRCGQAGHAIKECGNPPHCAVCAANGRKADHIVGSKPCKIPQKTGKGSKKSQSPKAATPSTGNLNHSAQAQDLWSQEVLKRSIDVGVIAEPYRILDRSDWLGDADSTVALVFGPKIVPPPSRSTTRGHGFVVADLRALTVVGVYFSPNRPIAEFEAFLLRLTTFVSGAANPVVVAGDFNAKSTRWGSPATDARGRAMADWLATTGLIVTNRGAASTCVRWQGESIVDLTLVSPSIACRMSGWRVLEEVETLSDHLYIGFDIASTSEAGRRIPSGGGPRWSQRCLDRDLLEEAAIVASMSPLPSDDVEECAEWLNEAARNICDASMPRAGPVVPRRQTYWWRPELKQLRLECVAARRRFLRYRRRRNRVEAEEEAHEGYRLARHALREAIKVAKKEAWEEFLNTLEQDPWGKPYKWVRQKLRPAAPPLTQHMQPDLRRSVLSALFPSRAEWSPPSMRPPSAESDDEEEDVPPVTPEELASAVHRMSLKNRAPGLDGVPGRVWVLAIKHLEAQVLEVFTKCLVQGRVPRRWKSGKLVLLRKDGRPEDQPSAYRPIVLIDEICKTLERVIVGRLNRHLEGAGPNLSDAQFGFRSRRSTIDAVARVRQISEEEISRGGVVLVVSLDISNAFNTLPWETIKEGLRYHRVPRYLRRTIGNYLSERSVQYPTEEDWEELEIDCGVPQGSSLGPGLWDIGYDSVLRGANLPGVELVAYADDTAVVCRAKSHREAKILATAAVAQVVRRIQALGLKVALNKSEALLFHGPRNAPPPGLEVIVSGTRIQVGSTMTYLGLVLDSRWSFREHFRRLSEKVKRSAGALASLLPNLGGPSLVCRRLYMGVVRSMTMYGAPIWAESLLPENRLALGRLQRVMATRAVRGYRTISRDAACLLAGSVPWDLDALTLADVYWRGAEVRAGGSNPLPDAVRRWRDRAKDVTIELWEERLLEPQVSVALVLAMRPVLREWLTRKHGALSFRLTQVLTGHGCFGRYLCEIANREESTRCHHCDCERDTAEHTVSACPAWTGQRAALTAAIGFDLSLPALVRAMVGSEPGWTAVQDFCEEVIAAKEEAERVRELEALDPRRRRRPRRRQVISNDHLLP
ncbi:uncharacterized protein LOC121728266 [Aricia agestis]|uniref:uncharacterized protein LOC121728266 n=1 Tax=Aricia agestis TaxID=91739 RepID=UPI001C207DE9|nr:uncharacterized protein LOC121728266 [Aricia agestis]